MALRPIASAIVLVAAVVAAWTWPPSARLLRGGLENNLGCLYLHGIGVTQDSRAAIDWYTRAAQRGLPTAQYILGFIYQTGNGVPPNARAAADWYARAAAQNHPESANNLAMLFADGSLGARDLPRARAWLIRARDVASPESRPALAENLAALERDMTADQLARSEALLATLPHAR